jgi:prepilin-type N-terminal cleavage/methylation domain-containing protein/prepilin-type processing-associated H-X9-DG protein
MVQRQGGFTLIELLVVIAIIVLLAAILFPVFATARGKARSTRCLANLKQIGHALSMYMDDYDGYYPWGIDPADHYHPEIWDSFPNWQAWLPYMPFLHVTLQPYIKSTEIWHCAADRGFDDLEDHGLPLDGRPTAFAALGTSYMYRTELTFLQARPESLNNPAQVNVFFDGYGNWHGGENYNDRRWNILYADGHAKTANRQQYDEAWYTPIY